MDKTSLTLDAPKAFILLCGLAFLPAPFGPKPQRFARQAVRDIRRAAVRNGFTQWDTLETLSVCQTTPVERRFALAAQCLDAAGPWVVWRCFRMAPGSIVREPVTGQLGSQVDVTLSVARALAHSLVH